MAKLDYFSDDEEEETDIEISHESIENIFKKASLNKFIIHANKWIKDNNAKVFNDIIDYRDATGNFEKYCSYLELDKKQIGDLETAFNDFYYSYPVHKKIPVKNVTSS